ncbi:PdaC/SigV domain-containing protein [Erythrobacter litoralis]|uniref:PdaC/SigV domain-containing protein n=1 Tax=Erythrobacter litoralis TaxID=39960 RepID=UPI002434F268|nr:DUF4163 domain-containing protein [Erythrobacter litoralis]
MRSALFLISLVLSTAGCSQPQEFDDKIGASSEGAKSVSARMESPDAEPVSLKEDAERYQFEWSYPAAAAAIPALAEKLDAMGAESLALLKDEANRDYETAKGESWEARPHSALTKWSVVANLPDYLSLSSQIATYGGGAHGNYTKTSMVWDKKAAQAVDGVEMFSSPVALGRALGSTLCDALNTQREARRPTPVEPGSTEWPNNCPPVSDATVLVGSSNGETFDRIGIYFGPYTAGPYAEGDYELNFPVTGAVLDAVKPEYASAFSIKR